MPKLHLVGITPDHRGLVLSEHARAKRGDMVLEIDDRLLEAIEKAQRLRIFDEGHRLESNALPSKRDTVNGTDVAGRLTPREIQARLRAGESVSSLARSSGTDEAWIRRFAAPVLAEQAKIIEQARGATFSKRGAGPSAVPLGPAVAANVIDRGVPLTLPDLEAAWGAYQHPAGGWHVTFSVPLRGRRQTAEWSFDLAGGELTARNKLASELGWRESGKKLPQPKPVKTAAPKRAQATPAESTATPTSAGDDATPADGPKTADVAKVDEQQGETVQALPLNEEASSPPAAGEHPRAVPAPARKAPARKSAAKPAPPAAKRAAAAVTETPVQSVVPVAPTEPVESMPPTDLDVVDVIVDLRDDETAREPAPIGGPPAPAGGPPPP